MEKNMPLTIPLLEESVFNNLVNYIKNKDLINDFPDYQSGSAAKGRIFDICSEKVTFRFLTLFYHNVSLTTKEDFSITDSNRENLCKHYKNIVDIIYSK